MNDNEKAAVILGFILTFFFFTWNALDIAELQICQDKMIRENVLDKTRIK